LDLDPTPPHPPNITDPNKYHDPKLLNSSIDASTDQIAPKCKDMVTDIKYKATDFP